MSRLLALAALACFLLFGGRALAQATDAAASSPAAIEVSLLTVGPGEIYWQRFGHNAIVIHDPARGQAVSYNYGMFDFEEANFFVNFLRGRMTYQISAEDPVEEIAWYTGEGRSITRQDLRLSVAQASALQAYLENNLIP